MQLTFREIILIIITTALSIIAVRISFTFDINKYLESKRKIAENKAKNACTHLFPLYKDNKIAWLKSAFISPVWTTNWVCQKCGMIRYDIDDDYEKLKIKYYFSHNKEYMKKEKKFEKYLRKAWF